MAREGAGATGLEPALYPHNRNSTAVKRLTFRKATRERTLRRSVVMLKAVFEWISRDSVV